MYGQRVPICVTGTYIHCRQPAQTIGKESWKVCKPIKCSIWLQSPEASVAGLNSRLIDNLTTIIMSTIVFHLILSNREWGVMVWTNVKGLYYWWKDGLFFFEKSVVFFHFSDCVFCCLLSQCAVLFVFLFTCSIAWWLLFCFHRVLKICKRTKLFLALDLQLMWLLLSISDNTHKFCSLWDIQNVHNFLIRRMKQKLFPMIL